MKDYKKKWGDKKDARWCKEAPGLQQALLHLCPDRTNNEAYLQYQLDITELLPYLEKKNAEHPDYKTTVFQAIIFAAVKMINERPKLNWYAQGRRFYERDEISAGFVARRRFTDHSEEALMFFVPQPDDTLDTLSYKIGGEVHEMRNTEKAAAGANTAMEVLKKLPRPAYMGIAKVVRTLDFFGKVPAAISDGDPNFSTLFLTNLGSVGCPAIYHHLSNYGTNSIMVAVGLIHKAEIIDKEGNKRIRDVVDLGITIDERIGDGFYFARSLKLLNHLFAHPEMLDERIDKPSNFEY